jgi:hypothetical protein
MVPLLNRGRPSVLWGDSWTLTWPSCRGAHRAGGCHQCVVRCASAGAERPECGLRVGPAVRAVPQAKKYIQRRPVPGQVTWTRAPNPALPWALGPGGRFGALEEGGGALDGAARPAGGGARLHKSRRSASGLCNCPLASQTPYAASCTSWGSLAFTKRVPSGLLLRHFFSPMTTRLF